MKKISILTLFILLFFSKIQAQTQDDSVYTKDLILAVPNFVGFSVPYIHLILNDGLMSVTSVEYTGSSWQDVKKSFEKGIFLTMYLGAPLRMEKYCVGKSLEQLLFRVSYSKKNFKPIYLGLGWLLRKKPHGPRYGQYQNGVYGIHLFKCRIKYMSLGETQTVLLPTYSFSKQKMEWIKCPAYCIVDIEFIEPYYGKKNKK